MRCVILAAALALTSGAAAHALPPASGSKCNSDWVNNEAAMQCFIDGQSDIRNGVKHPRYVACSQAGEVFCCRDDDRGNQDCENTPARTGAKDADWRKAILGAHNATLSKMGRWDDRPDPKRGTMAPKATSRTTSP